MHKNGGRNLKNSAQEEEAVTHKEKSMRKLLNIIGLFIFPALALTNLTTPIPTTDCSKEYLFFLVGSAITYFLLVNIYNIRNSGRKVVLTTLLLFGCFSIFMAFYSIHHPVSHC